MWFPATNTPAPRLPSIASPTPNLRPGIGKEIFRDGFTEDGEWQVIGRSSGSATVVNGHLTLALSEADSFLFALQVQGDSMIDAMVNDGDIVIMKPAQVAENGEMVAVRLTDEDKTTLKFFYKENGHVRLQPANPDHQPQIISDPNSIIIQGKVVLVIRQIGGKLV